MVALHHYLRKPPDRRSRPICYVVRLGDERVGSLFYGRPESTRCYAGELTYGSLDDVRIGKAQFDRWEILCLSRVWLSSDVQHGGRLARPELMAGVPGHTDRKGVYWPYVASWVIRQANETVGFDYLQTHPPCFVDQPYAVRCVLSYCDTRLHRGRIYPAAGFALARCNGDGIETWYTTEVAALTGEQDATIRRLARTSHRSIRIRGKLAPAQPLLF